MAEKKSTKKKSPELIAAQKRHKELVKQLDKLGFYDNYLLEMEDLYGAVADTREFKQVIKAVESTGMQAVAEALVKAQTQADRAVKKALKDLDSRFRQVLKEANKLNREIVKLGGKEDKLFPSDFGREDTPAEKKQLAKRRLSSAAGSPPSSFCF